MTSSFVSAPRLLRPWLSTRDGLASGPRARSFSADRTPIDLRRLTRINSGLLDYLNLDFGRPRNAFGAPWKVAPDISLPLIDSRFSKVNPFLAGGSRHEPFDGSKQSFDEASTIVDRVFGFEDALSLTHAHRLDYILKENILASLEGTKSQNKFGSPNGYFQNVGEGLLAFYPSEDKDVLVSEDVDMNNPVLLFIHCNLFKGVEPDKNDSVKIDGNSWFWCPLIRPRIDSVPGLQFGEEKAKRTRVDDNNKIQDESDSKRILRFSGLLGSRELLRPRKSLFTGFDWKKTEGVTTSTSTAKTGQTKADTRITIRTKKELQPVRELKPRDIVDLLLRANPFLKRTKDHFKYEFTDKGGKIEIPAHDAMVSALVSKGSCTNFVYEGNDCVGLFDETIFYSDAYEAQSPDVGFVSWDKESELDIFDVKSYDGFVLHFGNLKKGVLQVGDEVKLKVDEERRFSIMANHTSAHLLNFGIDRVLGQKNSETELTQPRTSSVDANFLSVDVESNPRLNEADLSQLQKVVNLLIFHDVPVFREDIALDDAKALNIPLHTLNPRIEVDASDRVRDAADIPSADVDAVTVVSVGVPPGVLVNDVDGSLGSCSLEACSGSHVTTTGAIRSFVITGVDDVEKGNLQRITAVSKEGAWRAMRNAEMLSSFLDELEREVRDELSPDSWKEKISALERILSTSLLPVDARASFRRRLDRLLSETKPSSSLGLDAEVARQLLSARLSRRQSDKPLIVRLKSEDSKTIKRCLLNAAHWAQDLDSRRGRTPSPAFLTSRAGSSVYCLCHVPSKTVADDGDVFTAEQWMRTIFAQVDSVLVAGTVNKRVAPELMFFGSVQVVDDEAAEKLMAKIERRAEKIVEKCLP